MKEASRYLGVSPQTVYLWVERKQIPHLRVMGRNIRFLQNVDLETFLRFFQTGDGECLDRENMIGVVYRRERRRAVLVDSLSRQKRGKTQGIHIHARSWQEAQRLLRERLQARDSNALDVIRKGEKLSLEQWADFFLENYSKPPVRAEKTILPTSESSCRKASQERLCLTEIGGHHCGRHRDLPSQ